MTTSQPGNPDRISVSLGEKLSQNYESKDFHFSYSTDVKSGETPDEAARRAYLKVFEWLSKTTKNLKS